MAVNGHCDRLSYMPKADPFLFKPHGASDAIEPQVGVVGGFGFRQPIESADVRGILDGPLGAMRQQRGAIHQQRYKFQ